MRKILKAKSIITTLVIIFAFSISIYTNSNCFSEQMYRELENGTESYLNKAGTWNVSPFTINGNSGWETINSTYDWCSGAGTWSNPYIIENITVANKNIKIYW